VAALTIIESFLGLMVGMVIAAVVGRLIWPVLPQKLLTDDLVKFFVALKALLSREPHIEKIRTQLAILPVEAQQAARQIRITGYTAAENEKISRLIRGLQALAMKSKALIVDEHPLPEGVECALRPNFERLETEFHGILDAFAERLRQGDRRHPFPSLNEALNGLNQSLERVRQSGALADEKLDVLMHTLQLANRYQSTVEALEECSSILQTLELNRYMGDYAL
jgi:hypothetical protein